MHPHFIEEEESAPPLLRLLGPLSKGKIEPSMAEVLKMTAIMRDATKRFDEMRALKRKLAEVARTSTKKSCP